MQLCLEAQPLLPMAGLQLDGGSQGKWVKEIMRDRVGRLGKVLGTALSLDVCPGLLPTGCAVAFSSSTGQFCHSDFMG